jgi:exopolysaccharide biosynthesis polyprenyl glycosylphosphotransferase
MTRHQTALFRRLLLAFDVAFSALAFWIALELRAWMGVAMPEVLGPLQTESGDQSYSHLLVVMLPAWTFAFWTSRTHDFRATLMRTTWRYLRAVGIGVLAIVVCSFWLRLEFLSRSFVFLFGVVQIASLAIGRIAMLGVIKRARGVADHRVLIVGCGPAAVAFARSARDRAAWNNRFVGHLRVPGENCDPAAQPRRGDLDDLGRLLDSEVIDEVVFASLESGLGTYEAALAACDLRGVDVLVTMRDLVVGSGKVELASVTGFDMPMIGMSRVPTSQGSLAAKRVLDLVASAIAIVMLAPLLLATAIAIRIESRGPILFKQVRSGRNGRKFVMFKFRSMCTDAEKRQAELMHLNEMDGPVFKIKHDPRITRVGRFIRKTSIDELPQLFNVLLGDMSLVGPRPPLPAEVAQYEAWQRRRLSVRPGITGMWQVSGRNAIDFSKWMELDLEYIDRWSLWLDVQILFRTLPAVLLRSGAS